MRVQHVHQVLPTWQDSNVILSPQHQAATEMSVLTYQPSSCCLLLSSFVSRVWVFDIQYSAKGSAGVSIHIWMLCPPPHLGLSVLGLYLLIPAALTPPNVAHCPLSPSIYYVLLSSAPVLLSLVALYYQFQLSQQRQTLTFDSLACLFTICTWALHLCTLQSVKYPYWRGKDK